MTGGEDGFLSRWSRRKRSGRADPAPEAGDKDLRADDAAEATDAPDLSGKSEAEILEALGLPDPDTLRAGDDFRAFMRTAVPEHLRRRALRRLWVSNPVLANLDGLNDYDGDFTGDTVAPGMLKTVYKVGVGIVRDLPDKVASVDADVAAATENIDAASDPRDIADSSMISEEDAEAGTKRSDLPENDSRPAGRRMRFTFGGDA